MNSSSNASPSYTIIITRVLARVNLGFSSIKHQDVIMVMVILIIPKVFSTNYFITSKNLCIMAAACARVALPFGSMMVWPLAFLPVPLMMPSLLKVWIASIA